MPATAVRRTPAAIAYLWNVPSDPKRAGSRTSRARAHTSLPDGGTGLGPRSASLPANTKGHIRQDQEHIASNRPTRPTTGFRPGVTVISLAGVSRCHAVSRRGWPDRETTGSAGASAVRGCRVVPSGCDAAAGRSVVTALPEVRLCLAMPAGGRAVWRRFGPRDRQGSPPG